MRRLPASAFAVLMANSAYLAAFANPTLFYMANAVLHLVLGLVLMVFALRLLKRWPRECTVFLLCGAFGCYLAARGNTTPHRWALYAHIAASAVVVVLVGARLLGSMVPRWQLGAFAGLAATFMVVPAGVKLYRQAHPNPQY